MGSSFYLHVFMLLCCCFHLFIMLTNSSSSAQPLCHEDESSSLLQFKHSFFINKSASGDPSAYSKVESWKKFEGKSGDCCSWDGVECDHDTGHVIGLKQLDLSECHFSGMLPVSLGSVTKLTYLDLRSNQFWGQIPASLGNLSQLTVLRLGENNFDAPTLPLTLGKLSNLIELNLTDMKIRGEIPQFLANLTQLSYLFINSNELVGQIPSWLMNLTKLTSLELSNNQLHGMIPSSVSQLKYLEALNLDGNNLSGEVELDIFLKLQNLVALELSGNRLTVFTKNITNATHPKLLVLGLESCNMKEFPNFLQFQDELEILLFGYNKIQGEIPTWFWNISKENIKVVDLVHNFLTGFEQHPVVISWPSLLYLNLCFNRLQGSIPIPPPSIIIYQVRGNFLSGEIPPSIICHKSSLQIIDLSDNNFSGTIPECLSSDSLLMLNLSFNNFHGTIPHMMGINLKMIDLSQNHLHGLVPRSLQNCTSLEILVLGNNQMEDTFPSWLGALPMLQVLILRSNRFHGAINVSQAKLKFAKLRIIDLSDNGFSGNLPSEYFENWNGMTMVKREMLTYMQGSQVPIGTVHSRSLTLILTTEPYMYSITMDNKGTHRLYAKIQKAFIAIDFSNNKFGGEIPESLGRLGGLQMLNLSNNNFTGVIPSSLANLTELESLDLSQNLFSGEIPQQLSQLNFLEFLDVSHNHLTGPIPRGNQFDTFENRSYDGNSGLCGYPLSQLCGNSEASPPPSLSFHGDDSIFPSGVVDWIIILLGYGSGLIVGLVIGHTLTTRYHEWFVEKFGTRKRRRN